MSWNFETVAGPYKGALGGVAPSGDGVLFSLVGESRILRLDAAGKVDEWRRFSSRTGGLAEGPHSLVYGCQEMSRRVCEFRPDGSTAVTSTTLDGRYHNFPNDCVVDRAGRVWFCDPHHPVPAFGPQFFPALPFAAVMRLARGPNHRWSMERLSWDTVNPRALALSPDEKTLYLAEGGSGPDETRELRAYPVNADGSLGQFEVWMSFGRDHRGPHRGIAGLCVDAEGNVLACGGSRASGVGPTVYLFSPSGRVIESHELPDDLPLRCAFGGPQRESLFVSTGTGRLWRANTGRRGLRRFD